MRNTNHGLATDTSLSVSGAAAAAYVGRLCATWNSNATYFPPACFSQGEASDVANEVVKQVGNGVLAFKSVSFSLILSFEL